MSGIFRTKKKKRNFFSAYNKPFETIELSWEARGLLGYLLTKPDGWECRNNDIINNGPAGRDKVARMIKELIDAGYMKRFRFQNESGQFDWVTEVYELPQELDTIPVKTVYGSAVNGSPVDGKHGDIASIDSVNTEKKGATPTEPPKPKSSNGANLDPARDMLDRAFQSRGGKLPTDGMTPEEIAVQEIREGQWRVKDRLRKENIVLALGYFLVAVRVKTKRPDFSPPGDGSVRSRWITAVSGHLSDNTPDELKQLYLDAVEIADEKGYFNDSPTSITNDALPRARRKATKPVGGWAALNDDVKRRYDGYGKQHGVTGEEFYNAQKEAAQKAQQEMSE
jgi:hypothetical protein